MQVGYEAGLELFEDGEVMLGESDDLTGEAVAFGVEAGFFLAFFGDGAGGFLRVEAVCGDLFF